MTKPLLKTILACSLVAATFTASAQSQCNNRDFEDTTFIGWSAATGTNQNGVLQPVSWTPGFVSNGHNAAVNDATAQQTLITTNFIDQIAIDPVTMLPDTQMTSLAPGGGFASVRIGNSINGFGCEKISYVFTVTPRNQYFQFQFASVMEDPNHVWDAQPYFMVNFYDQGGNVVTSVSDTIWAGDPSVPYITAGGNPMILYRRWTPISKDLSAYVGQNMTVEFVNSDCMFGGHFGYTYVDVSCLGSGVPNVWPGDADYDLQANNVDVLTLGVAYGATGTTRASATTNWQAEVSADWSQSVPLGSNYKHADTNGDGIVDLNDTLAISLNYGQGHAFRLGNPQVDPLTAPTLWLDVISDTVPPGGLITADVYLGSQSMPINDLYGISFTVDYDNSLVQSGSTQTSFTGSMIGIKNNTMIGFARDNYAGGENDITMCRNTHTEVNGYGYIGTVTFTAANVSTISTMNLDLSNVRAINGQMVNIPLATLGAPVVIDPAASVPVIPGTPHVALFPNPANESVVISTAVDQVIEITNTLGQVVYTTTATGTATTVDLNNFEAGVYFVNIYAGPSKVTEQLIVE